ncbi:MAG: methyl-accepting chemotaxis protein [Candidatus Omnitrophica bacterium]|nr:methyl-accepting chemotaxis protein [Candidatus Omnitrophota bacterium]
MADIKARDQRRNYFINKDFQSRFIIQFCLLVVFSGVLTIIILYFWGKASTTVAIVNSQVMVRPTGDFLFPVLVQTGLIVMVIVGLATIVVTLLFSHKIAGPLYHFRSVIQGLKEGDFSRDVHIRDYDQLQDLAVEMNAMIVAVRQQINLTKASIATFKNKEGNVFDKDIQVIASNIGFFKT